MLRRLILLAAALALAGCGGDPPPPDMMTGPGTLVLGTINPRLNGDSRWVDLTDGQDVEMAPGAQGGFHIWMLYRVSGVSGRVHMKRIADRIDQEGQRARVLTTQGVQDIPAYPPPYWQLPDPLPNFMCPTPIGVSVIDQIIELTVSMEDDAGQALCQSQVRVVAHCPPDGDPQRAFCMQICSG